MAKSKSKPRRDHHVFREYVGTMSAPSATAAMPNTQVAPMLLIALGLVLSFLVSRALIQGSRSLTLSSNPAGSVIPVEGQLDATAQETALVVTASPEEDNQLQGVALSGSLQPANQGEALQQQGSSVQTTQSSYPLQGSAGTARTR